MSGSLHPNSLMLLTWYPISTSYILPSLVHSLCSDHTVVLVPYLYVLFNSDFFINFLVYSIHLFSLNPSFHVHFEVSFQTFRLLFLFQFLIFLLIHLDYKNKIKFKEKQRNKTTILTEGKQQYSLLYLLLTFSRAILGALLVISTLFLLIFFF